MRSTPINVLFVFACALACAGCGGKAEQNADRLALSMTPPAPPGVVIIPPDSPKLAQIRVEPIKLEAMPAGDVTALMLTHEEFADEAARDRHHHGWSGSLDGLAAFVESAFAQVSQRRA